VNRRSNTSGAGNGNFRDLQTTVNDVGKVERLKDLIFYYRKCNPKSLLSATTLAGPSIEHGVLGGYILKKNDENTQKFI